MDVQSVEISTGTINAISQHIDIVNKNRHKHKSLFILNIFLLASNLLMIMYTQNILFHYFIKQSKMIFRAPLRPSSE